MFGHGNCGAPSEGGKDPRQKEGSPMGEKRAQEVVYGFEDVVGVCEAVAEGDIIAWSRIRVRELINMVCDLVGPLNKFARPSDLIGKVPSFRRTDTIQDIRRISKTAYDKLKALDLGKAPEDRKDLVDTEWSVRALKTDNSFSTAAGLMRLHSKHDDLLAEIELEPGDEE